MHGISFIVVPLVPIAANQAESVEFKPAFVELCPHVVGSVELGGVRAADPPGRPPSGNQAGSIGWTFRNPHGSPAHTSSWVPTYLSGPVEQS